MEEYTVSPHSHAKFGPGRVMGGYRAPKLLHLVKTAVLGGFRPARTTVYTDQGDIWHGSVYQCRSGM